MTRKGRQKNLIKNFAGESVVESVGTGVKKEPRSTESKEERASAKYLEENFPESSYINK